MLNFQPDGGYADLDPQEAADWAVVVCGTWLRLVTDDPPTDILDAAVE